MRYRPRPFAEPMDFRGDILSYVPPAWASGLQNCPKHRIKLAQLPTPIFEWSLPGIETESEIKVFIKRDDLTAAELSGSKIRKMEFLMAEALEKKCDHVITTGGINSNHCRTVAIVSRQLGFQPHLLLRVDKKALPLRDDNFKGNVMLECLMGSQIVLCGISSETDFHIIELKMKEYERKLRSEGANPFLIPLNNVDIVGFWGCIELYKELLEQDVLDQFDDIFVAVGSGVTVLGLAVGNYLTGSKLKIHGICVCETVDYFYAECDRYLQELGLAIESRDVVELDVCIGLGYSISTDDELGLLTDIASKTGILLDRVYTVKAVKGMLNQLNTKRDSLKGTRVLFIHTSGIHTLHDGYFRTEDKLPNSQLQVCTIHDVLNNKCD